MRSSMAVVKAAGASSGSVIARVVDRAQPYHVQLYSLPRLRLLREGHNMLGITFEFQTKSIE